MSDIIPLTDVKLLLDSLAGKRYFGSLLVVWEHGQVKHIEAKQILKREEIAARVK